MRRTFLHFVPSYDLPKLMSSLANHLSRTWINSRNSDLHSDRGPGAVEANRHVPTRGFSRVITNSLVHCRRAVYLVGVRKAAVGRAVLGGKVLAAGAPRDRGPAHFLNGHNRRLQGTEMHFQP
jgi:hypothetical protein